MRLAKAIASTVSSLLLIPIFPNDCTAAAITIGSLSLSAILIKVFFECSEGTFASKRQASRRTEEKLFVRRPFVLDWLVIPSPARWSRAAITAGEVFPSAIALSRYWRATNLFSKSSDSARVEIISPSTSVRYSLSTEVSSCA